MIGAGLAGSLLSIYLARRGFQVEIHERRPDMRMNRISAGRSINLALSARGLHALRDAGLHDSIMQIAIPMRGRMIHSTSGALSFQPYGRNEDEVIYATSRAALNMALLSAAENTGMVRIHFNSRCTGVDFMNQTVTLTDERSGDNTVIPVEVLIGTDGSASAIRHEMQVTGRFNFSQQFLDYGYKELVIPAGSEEKHLIERNALHIWPRGTFMLIALPNTDGSFTCTFFFPFEGENSFERLDSAQRVEDFFKAQFPDAIRLMPTLVEDFFNNPVGAMVTIKSSPWHVEGKALLLGDAAHAIVPFFGQGMNCCFEDCTVLDDCLGKLGDAGWEEVFRVFEARRKINTDAIAEMALENFIEMRDLVADPSFQLKKQVELLLEGRFPGVFVPKYSLVSFHRVPYAVALDRGRIQAAILDELCRDINTPSELHWDRAHHLVSTRLTKLDTL